MNYSQRSKALEVFKNRYLGGDKKHYKVRQISVSMNQNDYLVFYKYDYRYSPEKKPKCSTNISNRIKVFAVSSPDDIDKKLEKKIKGSFFPDRVSNHKIIEIIQQFKDNSNLLQKLSGKFRKEFLQKNKGKLKKNKSIAIGVRG